MTEEEAIQKADNDWIESMAVRWGEFTVTHQNPLGTVWPVSPGPTHLETVESHVKFLYAELNRLKAKAGE